MKFISFKNRFYINYPFGCHWNNDYIKESANIIYKKYKNNNISLVVRGTSGAMIAGGIITELHRKNISTSVDIILVRKNNESCHGYNLQGLDKYSKIVIIDDFIDTGFTIKNILNNLDRIFYSNCCKYDMLIVGNFISNTNIDLYNNLFERFNYVVCNYIK